MSRKWLREREGASIVDTCDTCTKQQQQSGIATAANANSNTITISTTQIINSKAATELVLVDLQHTVIHNTPKLLLSVFLLIVAPRHG
jgi:hypothetical protein